MNASEDGVVDVVAADDGSADTIQHSEKSSFVNVSKPVLASAVDSASPIPGQVCLLFGQFQ